MKMGLLYHGDDEYLELVQPERLLLEERLVLRVKTTLPTKDGAMEVLLSEDEAIELYWELAAQLFPTDCEKAKKEGAQCL